MRRILTAIVVVLGLAGCAGTNGSGTDPGAEPPDSDVAAAFAERAEVVAEAWRQNVATGAWRDGFVPLQELTVPPANGFADDAAKYAFMAGRYAADVPLPDAVPAPGTIRFPDGATLSVPLVSARDAYDALDQGDEPCRVAPAVPPPADHTPSGPDQVTSTMAPHVCAELTVTGVTLGETRLRTSRGEATVPAWLFTLAGTTEPVARVAVAPSAVHEIPTPSLPDSPHVPGLVTAQHLDSVDGATLVYQLGVGACDYDIQPLVHETPEVVVVAGSVRTKPGVCTAMLKMEPVRVTLAEPLGDRVVVDAGTGVPLTVR